MRKLLAVSVDDAVAHSQNDSGHEPGDRGGEGVKVDGADSAGIRFEPSG